MNIPKERVWIAPESTNLNGNRYDITKYAIAGGIKKEDIQGTIYTSRYKTKELKKRPKIEVLR